MYFMYYYMNMLNNLIEIHLVHYIVIQTTTTSFKRQIIKIFNFLLIIITR